MTEKITLEKLQEMVSELTPEEQIKLIASTFLRLSELKIFRSSEEAWQKRYPKWIEKFLKRSEEEAPEPLTEVDSAKDIRDIREEETSGL